MTFQKDYYHVPLVELAERKDVHRHPDRLTLAYRSIKNIMRLQVRGNFTGFTSEIGPELCIVVLQPPLDDPLHILPIFVGRGKGRKGHQKAEDNHLLLHA